MNVELTQSALTYPQNFIPENVDSPSLGGHENKSSRLVATLILAGGLLTAHDAIDSPAARADVVPATIGMPFEGRWAYSNETSAGCGSASNQTSHPSCHETYSGDWSTDLYGAAGSEVKLNISSSSSLTFSWDITASGTCGETRRINVLANGTSIGKLHVTHLNNAANTETPPTNGMVIGKIANLACNPGGTGKHIHMELKNTVANTHSCYTDHSNSNVTAGMLLAEGTNLGQLGSNNTDARQACTTPPPTPSPPTIDPIPALVQRGNETALVVVGPDKTLDYHFNPGGAGSWSRVDIPGSDAKSTPAAIVRPSGELNIAAQGDDGSLDFYVNPLGTNTWHKMEVAGNNAAHSAPSIIQRPSGETNIVVQGPNNTLDYYYNFQGNPQWYKVIVPNGQAYSRPAIVQRPNGETNIAVLGPSNSMDFYWNTPGSPTWGKVPVAISGWAMGAPSMVQRPTTGETVIAVQGQNHSLDIYINTQGQPQWGRIRAAEDNTTYNDTNPPTAVLRPDSELNIAVHGGNNSASVYYNAQGSPNWGQNLAAVNNYSLREPVMIQRPATGETDLVVVGPDRRVDYYMNEQGESTWGVSPIANNNSAY